MPSDDVPTRKYISWRDVDKAARSVVTQMMSQGYAPTHIVGVGRGGVIPAAIVAYQHSVLTGASPMIVTLYAQSYGGTNEMQRGSLQIAVNDLDELQRNGSNVLIIDDITDSGNTLAALQTILPEARTAVMFHKTCSKFEPSFLGPIEPNGDKIWYIFPWEKRSYSR